MVVMKFGGSSVADKEQIDKVLAIVRTRLGRKPVVVSSAHKGMTNALIAAAHAAASGDTNAGEQAIKKQQAVAHELGCPDALLAPFYDEIRVLVRGIALLKEANLRALDAMASFGERMAVRAIADYFTRKGIKSSAWDIWDLGFITDSNFGAALPLPGYETAMRDAVNKLVPKDTVPIITGFVGKNEAGEITTVGRNGSDFTGTLVGAALGSDEIEIWTDTDGVMTADPRVIAGVRSIPEMTFAEAAELANYGSRVLHPSSIYPAVKRNIPVRVLNTNRPEHPGTVIVRDTSDGREALTSIAYDDKQAVVSITSTQMLGQVGFLAKVFDVIGRNGVDVDMIATSEVSVSMTTNGKNIDKLNGAIKELEQFGKVVVYTDKTILCVVGPNLSGTRGIGAKVLAALSGAGINIDMVSYGADSINFSMVIDDRDTPKAVATLHKALFE
ncbi:MAG: aspartate kinase [Planctomycetaceae bacterium]|nr:aspartate kinase [Planctomycetaceae bacterium]